MAFDDNQSLLNSVEFLDVLDGEQIKLLAFASERKSFVAGEMIVEKGELSQGAYIINQGFILVGEGEKAFRISGPGIMLGQLSLLVKRVHHDNVMAQGQVDALFVPRNIFQKLIKQYPEIAADFAKKIEAGLDDYLHSLDEYKNLNG